jgi:magnesium transporter
MEPKIKTHRKASTSSEHNADKDKRKSTKPINCTLITYDEDNAQNFESHQITDITPRLVETGVNWLDIEGLHDIDLLEKVAEMFQFHPLMTEDVANVEHLPKTEEFENHIFFTLKMLSINPETELIQTEHLSLVLSENYLITFQEGLEGDVFNSVRERIFSNKGRIRRNNCDYLFYSLIDTVVDNYFTVLENFRERIETLEDSIISDPHKNAMNDILALKKELALIRKLVFPLVDELSRLKREESRFISHSTLAYLQDVLDHVNHLVSTFESFRDMLSSLMDLYMSNLSNSMNTVMKMLTIVSTIFIPLTFIAGIYGMNFENMPELKMEWGYYGVWTLMIGLGGSIYFLLKVKKWI